MKMRIFVVLITVLLLNAASAAIAQDNTDEFETEMAKKLKGEARAGAVKFEFTLKLWDEEKKTEKVKGSYSSGEMMVGKINKIFQSDTNKISPPGRSTGENSQPGGQGKGKSIGEVKYLIKMFFKPLVRIYPNPNGKYKVRLQLEFIHKWEPAIIEEKYDTTESESIKVAAKRKASKKIEAEINRVIEELSEKSIWFTKEENERVNNVTTTPVYIFKNVEFKFLDSGQRVSVGFKFWVKWIINRPLGLSGSDR